MREHSVTALNGNQAAFVFIPNRHVNTMEITLNQTRTYTRRIIKKECGNVVKCRSVTGNDA